MQRIEADVRAAVYCTPPHFRRLPNDLMAMNGLVFIRNDATKVSEDKEYSVHPIDPDTICTYGLEGVLSLIPQESNVTELMA